MNPPDKLPKEGRTVMLYTEEGTYLAFRGTFLGWTGRKKAWMNYLSPTFNINAKVIGWNGMPTTQDTIE